MKVLVTGGAGYIGSHTVQKILEAGHEVVVFDNLSTGFKEAVPCEAKLVVGDVCDTDLIADVIRDNHIDSVVHFAAKLIVPESIKKPLEYFQSNTLGVLALAHACVKNDVKKVVFSSTAAVYGDSAIDGLISENTCTAPLNPYGMSKLMSESILRSCDAPHGVRSVCLRYFNVAGAAGSGVNGQRTKEATHLIKVASQAAVGARDSVAVFGSDYPTPDGTGVRDYIHVEDLADIHVLALDYLDKGGASEIFNCGYGYGFSVREVINTIKKVSDCDFRVVEEARRPGDAAQLVADSRKAKEILKWTPKFDDLEVICASAFKWEKTLQALNSGAVSTSCFLRDC